MNTYAIEYRDEDPGCPVFRTHRRGYSARHALDRFWEEQDSAGYVVLRIARVQRDVPEHRWNWIRSTP